MSLLIIERGSNRQRIEEFEESVKVLGDTNCDALFYFCSAEGPYINIKVALRRFTPVRGRNKESFTHTPGTNTSKKCRMES